MFSYCPVCELVLADCEIHIEKGLRHCNLCETEIYHYIPAHFKVKLSDECRREWNEAGIGVPESMTVSITSEFEGCGCPKGDCRCVESTHGG